MDWTPEALIENARSFWTSSAIQTAVSLDVFTPLVAESLTEAELAEAIHCSPRGTRMLVAAMSALDLLRREEGRVALTPFSRRYLCRNSSDYLGHIIKHFKHLTHAWGQLDEAVRSGTSPRHMEEHSEDERESFLLGMLNMFMIQAGKTVPQIELGGRGRLLDLGGGTGSYAVQFCLRHSLLRATVFDLPTTRVFAEQHIENQHLSDRIDFVGGNFEQDPLPGGFDIAWLSHILHGVGPDKAAEIVNQAAHALVPGGLLLIQEFVVDNTCDGPLQSVLFGLNMLVNTPEGMAYTEQELRDMLLAAGTVRVERLPLQLPGGLGIVAGYLPG